MRQPSTNFQQLEVMMMSSSSDDYFSNKEWVNHSSFADDSYSFLDSPTAPSSASLLATCRGSSLRDLLVLSSSQQFSQLSLGDSSFVSISDDDDLADCSSTDCDNNNHNNNDGKPLKKRVSFGKRVEIREYKVIHGDHPSCPVLPISLGWEHSETLLTKDIDESRERQSSYTAPRRLSLEDRRKKIFGEVQENLHDFSLTDASLDDLIKDMDDCLSQVSLPPSFALPVVLPPALDHAQLYGGCFANCAQELSSLAERDDAPIVYWERVTCYSSE